MNIAQIHSNSFITEEKLNKALALGQEVINQEALALTHLAKSLGFAFKQALQAIFSCKGRLIITGMGKSGHIGRKIVATMSSVGTPSFFLHPAEASHGDLGTITANDIVLALSNSGESKELFDILHFTARHNITLIAVTKDENSSLAKYSSICLRLPNESEACPIGCAPTSSTTMTLALGDALAMALLDLRGFNAEDFHNFHPGGKLGSALVRVENIMHTADALPITFLGAKMPEALMEITGKGFGCVAVVNNQTDFILQGIIADGDLRRHMSENLLNKYVEEIMTKQPTTVSKEILVSRAINIMNEKQITSLMVTENERLIGLIHMHDCLRIGL